MARIATAYANNKGVFFGSPEEATISDLAALLDNPALARAVFENRAQIEDIFTQHDGMLVSHDDPPDGPAFAGPHGLT